MTFPEYLLRFIAIDFHYKYFRLLYRIVVKVSHKFGFLQMFRSLFKPLFGTPGIGSRFQGFIIRSTALCVSMIVLVVIAVFGVLMYLSFFALVFYAFKSNIILGLSYLGLIILIKILNYTYYPIQPIKNYDRLDEYANTGDITHRSFLRKIHNSEYKEALDQLFTNKYVIDFLSRSELDAIKLKKFLDEQINNYKPADFMYRMVEINQIVKFSHIKHQLFLVTLILLCDADERYLSSLNLDSNTLLKYLKFTSFYIKHDHYIWQDEYQLPPSGGLDKDWAVGYTGVLNRSGTDLTKLALKGMMPRLVGRSDVKNNVISALTKNSRNNVLIVGEPGCGKTTFVKALSREIALGTSIPRLKYKRIFSLDIGSLTSGTQGEINNRLVKIIKELESSRNVIVFIDEIHSISSNSSEDPNAVPIFSVLEPYLSDGRFQFIGTTSKKNYNKYIAANGSFAKAFEIVEMRSANEMETYEIMVDSMKSTESKASIRISYLAYLNSYNFAGRYIATRTYPDSAIELLNRAISVLSKNNSVITGEDIANVVSSLFKVPVNAINDDESAKLLNIESVLHERVIGQNAAITAISNALKRARVRIRDQQKPVASFLFAGPTGVGKTETAKALAELYFGSNDYMVRIDMSEFNDPLSVNRLIGDSRNPGQLSTPIKDRPYSLILLDEIEKSANEVQNLFLQILDDGRLTDGDGNLVNFTNTIIIATTNSATKEITASLAANPDQTDLSVMTLDVLKKYFPMEFLNRFNNIIPFTPLSRDEIKQIVRIKLNKLAERLSSEYKIKVTFAATAIDQIANEGYSVEWGARPVNRVIEDKVETNIAQKIIQKELQPGDTYEFTTI